VVYIEKGKIELYPKLKVYMNDQEEDIGFICVRILPELKNGRNKSSKKWTLPIATDSVASMDSTAIMDFAANIDSITSNKL
ncbi:17544_t:CDS:2, partial [Funneliformis geosporum]